MADTSRATFSLSASAAKAIEPPRLPNSFLLEFLFDGRKPARAVTGQAMLDYVPALEGPGTISNWGREATTRNTLPLASDTSRAISRQGKT